MMLLPRIAGRMMNVWTETFINPLLPLNGASSRNGAASAGSEATSGAAPARSGLPLLAPFALPQTAAGLLGQAWEYGIDRAQRSVLLLDVMRERGNASLDHSLAGKPPVLTFDSEMIMDGRTFDRPANYALLRITPRAHMKIDSGKRPYIIIDPRAGHGPGVAGFKEDSQVGMAMRSGHPCYLVTFFPEPVPGQTIPDVHHVETIFVKKVRELHPDANKPVVIGNCQGGWAVAILCAGSPEHFGPIMLTGAPLSYWAGAEGDSPVRFAGGLVGGTWFMSLLGDLGNGRFDGANVISNFELMNPANSMWGKTYNLFRHIDTEADRYLEFEKWWGAFFLTTAEEVRFIASELFTGNKLVKGKLVQDAGAEPIDLRDIRSPIIVFCSWGDNITPPSQALHWILDTYPTDEDLLANEQTIIYMLHDTVGHLGIFVSGDVARKEHAEVIRTLEMVEMLPPGLYEMKITDQAAGHSRDELIPHRYSVKFEERTLQDIRDMGGTPSDLRPFEAAARLSEMNERLYLRLISPVVKAVANEPVAALTRTLHPGRVRQFAFADRVNPAMNMVKFAAARVRRTRRPVSDENKLVHIEQAISDTIISSLDTVRDLRDRSQEFLFRSVFERSFVQKALGVSEHPTSERGDEAERRARLAERLEAITARDIHGGTLEAFARICAYLHRGQPAAEERGFQALKQIYDEAHDSTRTTLVAFKAAVREQTFLVRLDENRALETLPLLLPDREHRIATMHAVRRMEEAIGNAGATSAIDAEREARLRRVEELLGLAEPAALAAGDAATVPAS